MDLFKNIAASVADLIAADPYFWEAPPVPVYSAWALDKARRTEIAAGKLSGCVVVVSGCVAGGVSEVVVSTTELLVVVSAGSVVSVVAAASAPWTDGALVGVATVSVVESADVVVEGACVVVLFAGASVVESGVGVACPSPLSA